MKVEGRGNEVKMVATLEEAEKVTIQDLFLLVDSNGDIVAMLNKFEDGKMIIEGINKAKETLIENVEEVLAIQTSSNLNLE